MNRIIDSYKLYWKITLSKKVNMLLILVSFLYNFYLFYSFLFNDFDPGQALVGSSFIVQGGILVSIMIGIQMSIMEKKIEVHEVLSTIHGAIFSKSIGKILFFLSLLLNYLIINILVIFIMFKLAGISFSEFYIDTIYYFILYWGFSFLIGGLIGILLSFWVKGQSIYIISLVIWLIISPLNYPFFIQIGNMLNWQHTFEIINFLNIGQNNPHYPYHPFYGFSLENYQWLKRLLFFLILLIVLIGSFLIKGIKRKINIILIIILSFLTVVTINEIGEKHQVLRFDREVDALKKKDSIFYENTKIESRDLIDFEITNYDINLDINNFLKANVIVDLKNISKESHNNLDFLLYHDLKITNISNVNGESFKFTQNEDNIKVFTKDNILPNESISIYFEYEGISSPFFFANNQAINLLNHYPWLPTISNYNTAMYNLDFQTFRLPLQPNNEITYKLKLNRTTDIFSNLKQINENTWEGTKNKGIYLVAGSLNQKTINEKSVVYPLTWERFLTKFNFFNQYTEETIKKIDQELNIQRNIELNRYMFIDHSLNSDFPEQHIWIHEDTFIISPSTYFANDPIGLELSKSYLTYGIVPALTWKYDGIVREDLEKLLLFDYSYAYFLNIRNNEEDKYNSIEYFDIYIENLRNNNEHTSLKLTSSIKSYLDNKSISEERKILFFRNWYKELKENNNQFDINLFIEG